jgi:hypothetical protein
LIHEISAIFINYGTRSEYLAGIHDVVRIQSLLDRPHYVDGASQFLFNKYNLSTADTMLAGACAVEHDGALDEARVERFRPGRVPRGR